MKKFLTLFIILGITSCTNETTDSETVSTDKDKTYNWRLVTSWPKNYPGLGMAPERIADLVEVCFGFLLCVDEFKLGLLNDDGCCCDDGYCDGGGQPRPE